METDAYFRVNYDNDYFSSSDDNYTQGLSFELIDPIFEKNPLNILFINFTGISRHGFSIDHVSFTPDVISAPDIQYGERPFAAALYLKVFRSTDNIEKGWRLNSTLSVGVIGPIAYGEEGQTFIHEATDNWIPRGWKNQISNDVIFNYSLRHEKSITRLGNYFYFNSDIGIRAGTMNTDLHIGLSSIFGIFNSPLHLKSKKSQLQLYAYQNPKLFLIGYDASMQGGLFSNSIYTINSNNIARVKVQLDYGLVLTYKAVYLEYSKSIITKEFTEGEIQGWGGIRIGVKI